MRCTQSHSNFRNTIDGPKIAPSATAPDRFADATLPLETGRRGTNGINLSRTMPSGLVADSYASSATPSSASGFNNTRAWDAGHPGRMSTLQGNVLGFRITEDIFESPSG